MEEAGPVAAAVHGSCRISFPGNMLNFHDLHEDFR